VPDIGRFSMLRRSEIRTALETLSESVVVLEGPDGEALFDVPNGSLPDGDSPAPARLLGMWDSVLLAYHDRSRVLPETLRRIVIRQNGDVLPTVLVDGFVCGVWRPVEGGVEVRTLAPIGETDWDGIAVEAVGVQSLYSDRGSTYGRYDHWWDKLPTGTTRTFFR